MVVGLEPGACHANAGRRRFAVSFGAKGCHLALSGVPRTAGKKRRTVHGETSSGAPMLSYLRGRLPGTVSKSAARFHVVNALLIIAVSGARVMLWAGAQLARERPFSTSWHTCSESASADSGCCPTLVGGPLSAVICHDMVS